MFRSALASDQTTMAARISNRAAIVTFDQILNLRHDHVASDVALASCGVSFSVLTASKYRCLLLGVFVSDGNVDQVFALEVAAQDFFAERVFDMLLDRATQRSGAEVGMGALLQQELLGVLSEIDLEAVVGQRLVTFFSSISITISRLDRLSGRKTTTSYRRPMNSGRKFRSISFITVSLIFW